MPPRNRTSAVREERRAVLAAERSRVEALLAAERAAGTRPGMPRDRKPAVAARLKDQRVPVSEIAKLLGVSGTTASTWAKESAA